MKVRLALLFVLSLSGCEGSNHPPVLGNGSDTPAQVPKDTPSHPVADASSPGKTQVSDEELAALAGQLSVEDVEQRRAAPHKLVASGHPDVLKYLLAALDDPDLYVRIYSIQAIRDLRDPRAVDRLCKILEAQASEPLIVSNVMRAFAAIKSPAAVPVLIRLLNSEDDFTRYDAAFTLGEIGDKAAIAALEQIQLDDTIPEVRDENGRVTKTSIYSVGECARRALEKIRRP